MKINVGDYVRTKTGIHKVFEINEKATVWKYLCDKKLTGEWDGSYEYTTTRDENIIKSSPNIIDLVEVGDYVNGCMVINKNDDTIQIIQIIIPFDLKENDIKNIVTKEQFESMQYVIKEDKK